MTVSIEGMPGLPAVVGLVALPQGLNPTDSRDGDISNDDRKTNDPDDPKHDGDRTHE